MYSKLTRMVFNRYSLMVCGNSHRHCVSRCAYGTTYSVGTFVISGAFIVCASPAQVMKQAARANTEHRGCEPRRLLLVMEGNSENCRMGGVSSGGLARDAG